MSRGGMIGSPIVLSVVLVATSCLPTGIEVPLDPNHETRSPPTIPGYIYAQTEPNDSELIPASLLRSDLYEEARSYAIHYTDAYQTFHTQGWCQAGFVVPEVSAGVLAVLAPGIAGQVTSPAARTHWLETGIFSSAILTGLLAADHFAQCSKRDLAQEALAAERLTHLMNAGHLIDCANRVRTIAADEKNIESMPVVRAAIGPQQLSAMSIDKVQAIKVTITQKGIGAAHRAAGINADELLPDGGVPPLPPDYQGAVDTLESYIEIRSVDCGHSNEKSKEAAAESYDDRAHDELVKCLSISPTSVDTGALGGLGKSP